jgi:hypothetical protein
MFKENPHRFRDEDEEEEFWEMVSLALLLVIPIIIIFGLCVYCFKQRNMDKKKFQVRSKRKS